MAEATRTGRAEHLVLVGLMGTGKTTVGSIVAEQLGRPLVDSDTQVEERTGRTVREIWADEGEAAFRALERDALLDALRSEESSVVAAAGGVVLDASNREALAGDQCFVVWLRVAPDVLAVRTQQGDHRPLLDEDPLAALAAMERDRGPLYTEVADVVIEAGHMTPEEVAEQVLSLRPGRV